MMNRKPEMRIKRVRAQGYTQGCIKPTTFIQVHEQADDCLRISYLRRVHCSFLQHDRAQEYLESPAALRDPEKPGVAGVICLTPLGC